MALLSAVAGILLAAIFIPGTALFASTANNVSNDIVDLPLQLDDQASAQTTRLLASNGDLIAYFYEENRQDIPLAKISPLMQDAILSIEDARFYEHGALDLKGTLRALVNNASEGADAGWLLDHAAARQADPRVAGHDQEAAHGRDQEVDGPQDP